MEARSLRVALNAHMHTLPKLRVFAPATARVERSAEGAVVRVDDRATIACRLVVAAEGRELPLREEARIPVTRFPYGQTGLVFAVSHERPHNNTALEHFLPSGPFAQLPMCGTDGAPNVSAIVWTERRINAQRLLRLDDDALSREIGRRLGEHSGSCARVIGRRWSYPLSAMHAHRYYDDTRLVVVGDAAHGIHPIAGQGLNLGFRDVLALSRTLIEAIWEGADPGDPALLARYQRLRRPDNLMMLAGLNPLDRLFRYRQSAGPNGARSRHRRGDRATVEARVHAGGDGGCAPLISTQERSRHGVRHRAQAVAERISGRSASMSDSSQKRRSAPGRGAATQARQTAGPAGYRQQRRKWCSRCRQAKNKIGRRSTSAMRRPPANRVQDRE